MGTKVISAYLSPFSHKISTVMYMIIKKKPFIIAVLLPLVVGGLSALFTGGMSDFKSINKPALSPPGWLFPVVWTILYILMGVASYIVYNSNAPEYKKNSALLCYGIQLFFNFMWSIIFFCWKLYLFAFIWLLVLLALIICTALKFYKISTVAGYLLLPYIIWVSFAAYLNFGIYLLN